MIFNDHLLDAQDSFINHQLSLIDISLNTSEYLNWTCFAIPKQSPKTVMKHMDRPHVTPAPLVEQSYPPC